MPGYCLLQWREKEEEEEEVKHKHLHRTHTRTHTQVCISAAKYLHTQAHANMWMSQICTITRMHELPHTRSFVQELDLSLTCSEPRTDSPNLDPISRFSPIFKCKTTDVTTWGFKGPLRFVWNRAASLSVPVSLTVIQSDGVTVCWQHRQPHMLRVNTAIGLQKHKLDAPIWFTDKLIILGLDRRWESNRLRCCSHFALPPRACVCDL